LKSHSENVRQRKQGVLTKSDLINKLGDSMNHFTNKKAYIFLERLIDTDDSVKELMLYLAKTLKTSGKTFISNLGTNIRKDCHKDIDQSAITYAFKLFEECGFGKRLKETRLLFIWSVFPRVILENGNIIGINLVKIKQTPNTTYYRLPEDFPCNIKFGETKFGVGDYLLEDILSYLKDNGFTVSISK